MPGNKEWNESLWGCCSDFESCFCGCFFTPCVFGQNAERIDDSSCILMCCLYALLMPCYLCWIPHCLKRGLLREKYGLRPDPHCSDCPAACCCGPCAHCQETRFLERQRQESMIVPGLGPMTIQPQDYY